MILHVPERIYSTPVPGNNTSVTLRWTPPNNNLRSLIYVFPHPILPTATKAFFAGSFDLLVKRFEIEPDIFVVRIDLPDSTSELHHVVVLAQTAADTLAFVSDVEVLPSQEGVKNLGSVDLADDGFNPAPLTAATASAGFPTSESGRDDLLVGLGTAMDTPQIRPGNTKVVVSGRPVPTGSLSKAAPMPTRLGDENFDLQRELRQKTKAYLHSTQNIDKKA